MALQMPKEERSMSRRTLLAAAAVACLVSFGIRAQDRTVQFHGALTSATEVPPNQSEATGTLHATLDRNTKVLTYDLTYQGLSGPASAMHFHGPAQSDQKAGVQLPIQAPLNSPVHGTTGQLSDQQVQQLLNSDWYVNVHTKANPGGEIRGQVLHGGP
jgi:hypothetical protein